MSTAFISGVKIRNLIHEENIDRKFGNVQHIIEASVGEFNPSFADDLDWRFVTN